MKKCFFRSMLVSVMLVCLFAANPAVSAAAATSEDTGIQPRYTGIFRFAVDLDITKAGYASCAASVSPNTGYSVDLTMELQQDGTTIKSWTASDSKTFAMDKGYFVVKGHDYQVVATASVKNSNGVVVSTPSLSSNVVSY